MDCPDLPSNLSSPLSGCRFRTLSNTLSKIEVTEIYGMIYKYRMKSRGLIGLREAFS